MSESQQQQQQQSVEVQQEQNNNQSKDKNQHSKQPKEKKEKKEEKKKGFKIEDYPLPEYIEERLKLWEEIKQRRAASATERPIKITLPNGSTVEGTAHKTTAMDVAAKISQSLANNSLVAKVNGKLVDLGSPLTEDCTLELLGFDSAEGKKVFWHSSAHVLGQAMERRYGGLLCVGPPLDDGGFYYDMRMDHSVSADDFEDLKQLVAHIVKEKQPFERLELTKQEALQMFRYNTYKQQIISSKVPDDATCTAYRCGPLIDLCKGPHVPSTARIKAFDLFKNSSAYWLGKAENETLQRIYGIAFPEAKQLKEWIHMREEAAKRDHRVIGKAQELFFFDQMSPGSCFFLPHGARIYNKLMEYIRSEYRNRGFSEVISPNFYNKELFETSGHWANYRENMFQFECEGQTFALKPMNCPGHCLMFAHRARSYRELPLRFADFGVLHRNELSGALTGLTRVRRFQQDDAHIFCQADRIEEEIMNAFHFMKAVYGIFGFKFDLELSTRPEKHMGEREVWDKAEAALEKALNNTGYPWKLNPGDGAFYGPKIDIHITDAMGRSHQCATIQLDFTLPIQFKLEYQTETGIERPVMIHRAILGSVERFFAILTEHLGGKWPLWLSPRQFLVVPVSDKFNAYAEVVQKAFHDAGFFVDSELSDKTFQKKMMNARQQGLFNYYLVVGEQEQTANTVNIRTRDNEVVGAKSLDQAIADFKKDVSEYK